MRTGSDPEWNGLARSRRPCRKQGQWCSGEGLKQQSLKQPFIANGISQQKNFLKLCFISTIQFREPLHQSRSRNAGTSWCLYHGRTQLLAEVRRTDCRETQHWHNSGILCVCTAPRVPHLLFLFLGHSWTWKWYFTWTWWKSDNHLSQLYVLSTVGQLYLSTTLSNFHRSSGSM